MILPPADLSFNEMRSTKSDVYMFNGKFIFDLINGDLAASLLPCSHVQTLR